MDVTGVQRQGERQRGDVMPTKVEKEQKLIANIQTRINNVRLSWERCELAVKGAERVRKKERERERDILPSRVKKTP